MIFLVQYNRGIDKENHCLVSADTESDAIEKTKCHYLLSVCDHVVVKECFDEIIE